MPLATHKPRRKARLDLRIVVEWDTPAERSAELRKAAAELVGMAEMDESEKEGSVKA